MLTFNRHIYQSANRSSERRLGPVGFPKLSEIPFLTEARIRSDEKITEMNNIALMVKSVIAWITTKEDLGFNQRLSPVRVKSRTTQTFTHKQ